jgi:hypothetical protein
LVLVLKTTGRRFGSKKIPGGFKGSMVTDTSPFPKRGKREIKVYSWWNVMVVAGFSGSAELTTTPAFDGQWYPD